MKTEMPARSNLKVVFRAFVNGRFTKKQILKLCTAKGFSRNGTKETLISKVMELYSPEELAKASGIIQRLYWHERLILLILLSGPNAKREILEHRLIQGAFSKGVPEAAFGRMTFKILNPKEASNYLSRKVSGLLKKHILLMKKKQRRGIYSIHPWFLPYLKKRLTLPSEEEITRQIREHARMTMQFFIKEFPPTTFWKTWKNSLKNFQSLITELAEKVEKGKGNLRFGLPAVAVSSIANQYYCEKKVELTQRYGRKETTEMKLGNEAHEKLLADTVKTRREKVWKQIASGLPTMAREMPLLGKYRGIILMGLPDGIFFVNGAPELLLEHKFTKSCRPWREYHIQARVYCLLLYLIGFNIDKLKYALILAPPECRGKRELKEIVKKILACQGKDLIQEEVAGEVVKVYVTDFEIDQTRQDLDWALGFWKKEREAMPTRKEGKCATCEFKQTCPDSLADQLRG